MSQEMTPLMKARVAFRLLFLQTGWEPARMQATGFLFALDPWLGACWGFESEELRRARLRHLEYFNTHPIAAWLLAGIVCRGEAAAAAVQGVQRQLAIEKISRYKTDYGASLAGIYDSLFWGALRPASAVVGILCAFLVVRLGIRFPFFVVGGAAALAAYNVPAFAARWIGFQRGLERGENALVDIASLGVQTWIVFLRRATAAGAVLAGLLWASILEPRLLLAAVVSGAAGLALSWRGVEPLMQAGFVGAAAAAVSATGLWK